jgi:hypothetical protein
MAEIKKNVDILMEKEYVKIDPTKKRKIIDALKSLEGIKRTLQEILKT